MDTNQKQHTLLQGLLRSSPPARNNVPDSLERLILEIRKIASARTYVVLHSASAYSSTLAGEGGERLILLQDDVLGDMYVSGFIDVRALGSLERCPRCDVRLDKVSMVIPSHLT